MYESSKKQNFFFCNISFIYAVKNKIDFDDVTEYTLNNSKKFLFKCFRCEKIEEINEKKVI